MYEMHFAYFCTLVRRPVRNRPVLDNNGEDVTDQRMVKSLMHTACQGQ